VVTRQTSSIGAGSSDGMEREQMFDSHTAMHCSGDEFSRRAIAIATARRNTPAATRILSGRRNGRRHSMCDRAM